MNPLETKYGALGPAEHVETAPDGSLAGLVPAGLFTLDTPLGRLIPQFSTDDMRRPKVEPLLFHPNGTLRSIALEERTEVATPLGPMRAELLTFYPCGNLRRVFPLNGKLSGYWTEKEEAALIEPMTVATPAGTVTARLVGVQFHPDGALRSLTLWPGETVEADTPAGRIPVRIGLSFHRSGKLRSVEPARPVQVSTPLGMLEAFDPDALGIHGDLNSLVFGEDGSTASLATPAHTVEVTLPDETARLFEPEKTPNLCDERLTDIKALWISFPPGKIVFGREEEERQAFPLAGHQFKVGRLLVGVLGPIGYDCGI